MKELKKFFEKWGFGIKKPPLLDTEITFIKKIPYFENVVCLCVAILKDKKYMLFTICETKCKWLDDTITEFDNKYQQVVDWLNDNGYEFIKVENDGE